MTVRKADLEKQTQGREKRLEQDRNHFRIWAQEAGSRERGIVMVGWRQCRGVSGSAEIEFHVAGSRFDQMASEYGRSLLPTDFRKRLRLVKRPV